MLNRVEEAGLQAVEHQSVLPDEAIDYLQVRPNGRYVDGTVGSGGHAWRIASASAPNGRLLGLDVDPKAIARSAERLQEFGRRVTLVQSNFDCLFDLAREHGILPLDGVLLDLGVSSAQLGDSQFGLSFQRDDYLDMRLDPNLPESGADLINRLDEDDLADILYRYGEERAGRRIARAIVKRRPIETTKQLASIVAAASGYERGRTHPATRTFQAIRIAVNDELGALQRGLQGAIDALGPGGRLVVISFHSLEDRIVKQRFVKESRGCICPPEIPVCRCGKDARLRIVTRRPVTASDSETARNPRARSAKLRAAERLGAAA